MNNFTDLYSPDKRYGKWMSEHQGLSIGMDLHDWKQFVTRACQVIRTDPDPERRLHKTQRLKQKAIRVGGNWGEDYFLMRSVNVLIAECQHEIRNRVNVRLVQLSLWEAQS